MSQPAYVSHHACDRWNQRALGVDDGGDSWGARSQVQDAVKAAVLIPNRLTARWVPRYRKAATAQFRKQGIRYRFHPAGMLVMGGKRVITVLPASEDDLATVLVWMMLGQWLDEVPEGSELP